MRCSGCGNFLGFPCCCWQQQLEQAIPLKRLSLVGVGPIVLSVETYGGIDKNSIQLLATQQLKKAGISVIADSAPNSASRAHLYLVVTLACAGSACGYTTRLSLEEPVKVLRTPAASSKATTWSNGYQNAISRAEVRSLQSLVTVDVSTLIHLFAAEVNGHIERPQ
jgi:hypothetical protein